VNEACDGAGGAARARSCWCGVCVVPGDAQHVALTQRHPYQAAHGAGLGVQIGQRTHERSVGRQGHHDLEGGAVIWHRFLMWAHEE
jgi:hypothetical protein